MSKLHNLFNTLCKVELGDGRKGRLYSLPRLEKEGIGPISRLPVSIRLVLESVLRSCDGKRVSEQNVRALANWKPTAPRVEEIPFVVARIVLQDFTGVPLLVDLAAMRSAVARLGKNPKVGHAGFRNLQGSAAGDWHRAPGQPRIPRKRGTLQSGDGPRRGSPLLSGHFGWYGFAYDND